MYRKCVTEVSARHQKQAADALLELMTKMPYEDITVTQLCQTAGITRRIFYHLFSGKTGALWALLDHAILQLESYSPRVQDDSLRFFLYWKENRRLLEALQANRLSGTLLERMIACVLDESYDLRYWLKKNGWAEEEKDVIIFHLTGVMGIVFRWYYSGFRESPEEMAALLKKIITKPLTI